jgi:hypothetical protein
MHAGDRMFFCLRPEMLLRLLVELRVCALAEQLTILPPCSVTGKSAGASQDITLSWAVGYDSIDDTGHCLSEHSTRATALLLVWV